MVSMIVPRELEARVAPLIGTPFVAKGDTPDGWDCRGCARWCLKEHCGVETPDYRDLYTAADVRLAGRAQRSRLIAERLAHWRPVEPQAGVIAWLEWLGGAGHVGFMLSPRRLIHADARAGTVLLDLDEPSAAYRLRGAFVPDWITEIHAA
ncbi:hypothetical protein [Brevundimonas sp.]|uniref:hypothetical protein n=1 Tax=Brevundimonas sp. TaxID=1871086 RepID=UPI002FCA3802